jgi:hypothetical protein
VGDAFACLDGVRGVYLLTCFFQVWVEDGQQGRV